MVVSDLVIVSIDQHIPKKPKSDQVTIQTHNRNGLFVLHQYHNSFFLAQSLRGIWYSIYPKKERMYTDAFCDLAIAKQSKRLHVCLRDCWIDVLCGLIKHFVQSSPHHLIGIMFRIDYPDKEVIHSVRSVNEYISDLLSGNVHFDELYFVTE